MWGTAAITYKGDGDDGILKTVGIATDGQITGNVYAKAAIKTHDTVYTGSEESTTGDTFVTKSYQWTTNPSTGSAWTWDEIDALQIGVELKTDEACDLAACTQVYVRVDYEGF